MLIAEDDPDLRFVIVRLLSLAFPGATLVSYVHGQEALVDFDLHGADLVISNHSMPVMDGPTFVKHLRTRSPGMPILMVSGSPEAEQEGKAAGITRFLDKSELVPLLVPTVRELLKVPTTG